MAKTIYCAYVVWYVYIIFCRGTAGAIFRAAFRPFLYYSTAVRSTITPYPPGSFSGAFLVVIDRRVCYHTVLLNY